MISDGARKKSGKDKGIKKNADGKKKKTCSWDMYRFIILDENKASMVNFLCTEMSQIYRGHTRKGLVFCKGFADPKKVWSSSDRSDLYLQSYQSLKRPTYALLCMQMSAR